MRISDAMGNTPAVKRLRKEHQEIQKMAEEASGRPYVPSAPPDAANAHGLPFSVHPLESDFLEWHFTLAGPADTPYAGGLYHGRISFPADYPFAPPNVFFATPSGRFETNTRICLSVTSYHPEQWQPAWGARTMLLAIRDHFSIEDRGAIGYVSRPDADRRRMALESRAFSCKACGYCAPCTPAEVQRLIIGAESAQDSSSGAQAQAAVRRPDGACGVRPEVVAAALALAAFLAYNLLYSS